MLNALHRKKSFYVFFMSLEWSSLFTAVSAVFTKPGGQHTFLVEAVASVAAYLFLLVQ
jgi:hypothetical protein